MSLLEQRIGLILVSAAEITKKAEVAFGITMPSIIYDFTSLKGRVAGRATYRPLNKKAVVYINSDLMISSEVAWKDCLEDTLPHEIAHIVCMSHPNLGSGHDSGWKLVASTLGAAPLRCHSIQDIVYGTGDTYIYTDSLGNERVISATKHKRIQRGTSYTNRATGAQLTKACSYRLANQECVQQTCIPGSTISAPSLGSKATKARAIMRQCVEQKLTYERTIELMSIGSGYSIALSKACYKDAQEKHGINA